MPEQPALWTLKPARERQQVEHVELIERCGNGRIKVRFWRFPLLRRGVVPTLGPERKRTEIVYAVDAWRLKQPDGISDSERDRILADLPKAAPMFDNHPGQRRAS